MRRAFIADDGCGLLTADYSQIELRVLAHLAEDPGLIDAFERGADVHTTTAAKVFDVDRGRRSTTSSAASPRSSTTASRTAWRPTGSGSASTSPPSEAARDPRRLLRRLPEREGVHGATRCGRRRSAATPPRSSAAAARSPSSSSDNFRIRQMGERMAQNAPVQGSAADIFKLAMIDLDRALDDGRLASRGCCSPCTTSSCSRCPSASASVTEAARARGDGERHRAARAARRRHRLRPQLGRRRSSEPAVLIALNAQHGVLSATRTRSGVLLAYPASSRARSPVITASSPYSK